MYSRRLQDMSYCYVEDVFKASSRYVLKRLPEVLVTNKMFTRNESISVSIKSIFVSSKSLPSKPISEKSKANSRQIQDTLLRPQ